MDFSCIHKRPKGRNREDIRIRAATSCRGHSMRSKSLVLVALWLLIQHAPPNMRIHLTGYSGLRPLPPAGDAGRWALAYLSGLEVCCHCRNHSQYSN